MVSRETCRRGAGEWIAPTNKCDAMPRGVVSWHASVDGAEKDSRTERRGRQREREGETPLQALRRVLVADANPESNRAYWLNDSYRHPMDYPRWDSRAQRDWDLAVLSSAAAGIALDQPTEVITLPAELETAAPIDFDARVNARISELRARRRLTRPQRGEPYRECSDNSEVEYCEASPSALCSWDDGRHICRLNPRFDELWQALELACERNDVEQLKEMALVLLSETPQLDATNSLRSNQWRQFIEVSRHRDDASRWCLQAVKSLATAELLAGMPSPLVPWIHQQLGSQTFGGWLTTTGVQRSILQLISLMDASFDAIRWEAENRPLRETALRTLEPFLRQLRNLMFSHLRNPDESTSELSVTKRRRLN